MGTRYHLLMSSRIDSTLYRNQTVASAVGCPSSGPSGGARGGKGAELIHESAPVLKARRNPAQLWRGREGREGRVFEKLLTHKVQPTKIS